MLLNPDKTGAALAAALFLAPALLAITNAQAPPVQIDSCGFVRAGSFEHSVRVEFHNTTKRTVTGVSFDIRNGPHSVTVHAHGSFAPKVSITRTLTTPTWELYHAPAQACSVTSVRFADGSTWSSGH